METLKELVEEIQKAEKEIDKIINTLSKQIKPPHEITIDLLQQESMENLIFKSRPMVKLKVEIL
jgi:hypothetical protein